MNAHQTQLQRVRDRVLKYGYITRNECLSTFPAITRLGARINDLKAEGFEFEAKQEGGDFVYRVVKRPAARQLTLV